MPFKKGHKPTYVKQKGDVSKRNKEILKTIETVIGYLNETIEEDIAQLRPAERTKMWNDLQEYIRPKLARTEHVGDGGEPLFPQINVIAKDADKS